MMKVIMHSGKLVDASAPIKRTLKYDTQIELPTSLAELQSFGGPQDAHQRGILVRKQQS